MSQGDKSKVSLQPCSLLQPTHTGTLIGIEPPQGLGGKPLLKFPSITRDVQVVLTAGLVPERLPRIPAHSILPRSFAAQFAVHYLAKSRP